MADDLDEQIKLLREIKESLDHKRAAYEAKQRSAGALSDRPSPEAGPAQGKSSDLPTPPSQTSQEFETLFSPESHPQEIPKGSWVKDVFATWTAHRTEKVKAKIALQGEQARAQQHSELLRIEQRKIERDREELAKRLKIESEGIRLSHETELAKFKDKTQKTLEAVKEQLGMVAEQERLAQSRYDDERKIRQQLEARLGETTRQLADLSAKQKQRAAFEKEQQELARKLEAVQKNEQALLTKKTELETKLKGIQQQSFSRLFGGESGILAKALSPLKESIQGIRTALSDQQTRNEGQISHLQEQLLSREKQLAQSLHEQTGELHAFAKRLSATEKHAAAFGERLAKQVEQASKHITHDLSKRFSRELAELSRASRWDMIGEWLAVRRKEAEQKLKAADKKKHEKDIWIKVRTLFDALTRQLKESQKESGVQNKQQYREILALIAAQRHEAASIDALWKKNFGSLVHEHRRSLALTEEAARKERKSSERVETLALRLTREHQRGLSEQAASFEKKLSGYAAGYMQRLEEEHKKQQELAGIAEKYRAQAEATKPLLSFHDRFNALQASQAIKVEELSRQFGKSLDAGRTQAGEQLTALSKHFTTTLAQLKADHSALLNSQSKTQADTLLKLGANLSSHAAEAQHQFMSTLADAQKRFSASLTALEQSSAQKQELLQRELSRQKSIIIEFERSLAQARQSSQERAGQLSLSHEREETRRQALLYEKRTDAEALLLDKKKKAEAQLLDMRMKSQVQLFDKKKKAEAQLLDKRKEMQAQQLEHKDNRARRLLSFLLTWKKLKFSSKLERLRHHALLKEKDIQASNAAKAARLHQRELALGESRDTGMRAEQLRIRSDEHALQSRLASFEIEQRTTLEAAKAKQHQRTLRFKAFYSLLEKLRARKEKSATAEQKQKTIIAQERLRAQEALARQSAQMLPALKEHQRELGKLATNHEARILRAAADQKKWFSGLFQKQESGEHSRAKLAFEQHLRLTERITSAFHDYRRELSGLAAAHRADTARRESEQRKLLSAEQQAQKHETQRLEQIFKATIGKLTEQHAAKVRASEQNYLHEIRGLSRRLAAAQERPFRLFSSFSLSQKSTQQNLERIQALTLTTLSKLTQDAHSTHIASSRAFGSQLERLSVKLQRAFFHQLSKGDEAMKRIAGEWSQQVAALIAENRQLTESLIAQARKERTHEQRLWLSRFFTLDKKTRGELERSRLAEMHQNRQLIQSLEIREAQTKEAMQDKFRILETHHREREHDLEAHTKHEQRLQGSITALREQKQHLRRGLFKSVIETYLRSKERRLATRQKVGLIRQKQSARHWYEMLHWILLRRDKKDKQQAQRFAIALSEQKLQAKSDLLRKENFLLKDQSAALHAGVRSQEAGYALRQKELTAWNKERTLLTRELAAKKAGIWDRALARIAAYREHRLREKLSAQKAAEQEHTRQLALELEMKSAAIAKQIEARGSLTSKQLDTRTALKREELLTRKALTTEHERQITYQKKHAMQGEIRQQEAAARVAERNSERLHSTLRTWLSQRFSLRQSRINVKKEATQGIIAKKLSDAERSTAIEKAKRELEAHHTQRIAKLYGKAEQKNTSLIKRLEEQIALSRKSAETTAASMDTSLTSLGKSLMNILQPVMRKSDASQDASKAAALTRSALAEEYRAKTQQQHNALLHQRELEKITQKAEIEQSRLKLKSEQQGEHSRLLHIKAESQASLLHLKANAHAKLLQAKAKEQSRFSRARLWAHAFMHWITKRAEMKREQKLEAGRERLAQAIAQKDTRIAQVQQEISQMQQQASRIADAVGNSTGALKASISELSAALTKHFGDLQDRASQQTANIVEALVKNFNERQAQNEIKMRAQSEHLFKEMQHQARGLSSALTQRTRELSTLRRERQRLAAVHQKFALKHQMQREVREHQEALQERSYTFELARERERHSHKLDFANTELERARMRYSALELRRRHDHEHRIEGLKSKRRLREFVVTSIVKRWFSPDLRQRRLELKLRIAEERQQSAKKLHDEHLRLLEQGHALRLSRERLASEQKMHARDVHLDEHRRKEELLFLARKREIAAHERRQKLELKERILRLRQQFKIDRLAAKEKIALARERERLQSTQIREQKHAKEMQRFLALQQSSAVKRELGLHAFLQKLSASLTRSSQGTQDAVKKLSMSLPALVRGFLADASDKQEKHLREQRKMEEERFAELQRLSEQQRIHEQHRMFEQRRISEQQKATLALFTEKKRRAEKEAQRGAQRKWGIGALLHALFFSPSKRYERKLALERQRRMLLHTRDHERVDHARQQRLLAQENNKKDLLSHESELGLARLRQQHIIDQATAAEHMKTLRAKENLERQRMAVEQKKHAARELPFPFERLLRRLGDYRAERAHAAHQQRASLQFLREKQENMRLETAEREQKLKEQQIMRKHQLERERLHDKALLMQKQKEGDIALMREKLELAVQKREAKAAAKRLKHELKQSLRAAAKEERLQHLSQQRELAREGQLRDYYDRKLREAQEEKEKRVERRPFFSLKERIAFLKAKYHAKIEYLKTRIQLAQERHHARLARKRLHSDARRQAKLDFLRSRVELAALSEEKKREAGLRALYDKRLARETGIKEERELELEAQRIKLSRYSSRQKVKLEKIVLRRDIIARRIQQKIALAQERTRRILETERMKARSASLHEQMLRRDSERKSALVQKKLDTSLALEEARLRRGIVSEQLGQRARQQRLDYEFRQAAKHDDMKVALAKSERERILGLARSEHEKKLALTRSDNEKAVELERLRQKTQLEREQLGQKAAQQQLDYDFKQAARHDDMKLALAKSDNEKIVEIERLRQKTQLEREQLPRRISEAEKKIENAYSRKAEQINAEHQKALEDFQRKNQEYQKEFTAAQARHAHDQAALSGLSAKASLFQRLITALRERRRLKLEHSIRLARAKLEARMRARRDKLELTHEREKRRAELLLYREKIRAELITLRKEMPSLSALEREKSRFQSHQLRRAQSMISDCFKYIERQKMSKAREAYTHIRNIYASLDPDKRALIYELCERIYRLLSQ